MNQTARRRKPGMRLICKNLDLTSRTMSDFAIHRTADIIGEADWPLSRTRALLAPAQPVLRILDKGDPPRQTRRQEMNGGFRFHRAVFVELHPDFYT